MFFFALLYVFFTLYSDPSSSFLLHGVERIPAEPLSARYTKKKSKKKKFFLRPSARGGARESVHILYLYFVPPTYLHV